MSIAHIASGSCANPAFRQFFHTIGNFPRTRINLMKTTICALCFLCFLCATTAFGQSAPVLSNVPSTIQMSDHPQHASEHPMAKESSLFSVSPYGYAQGEVPLAELGSLEYQTPLGDEARAYRKEHTTAAKAVKVFED